jgi:Holliday junction resolvasome RuvABC endonuclease subunit
MKVIRILSFDPGLTCTGWSIGDYDIETGMLTINKYGKIEGKKLLIKNKELLAIYSKQFVQLNALAEAVSELTKCKPNYVVVEDAFHQPGRTSAYAALILCIRTIEVVIAQNLNLPVNRLPPCKVKSLSTTYGNANKATVQEAILSDDLINVKETRQNPLSRMVEHEADAIAVAKAFVMDILPTHINK